MKQIPLLLAVLGLSLLPAVAQSTNLLVIPFPDPRLAVHGLAWFNEDTPVLRRLPARLSSTFRAPVWSLAQNTSGGRIRFRTDSRSVAVSAVCPNISVMPHMTSAGENGIDLYVDDSYFSTAWPGADGSIAPKWGVGAERKMRDITIYLPLYKGIKVESVTLEAGSRVEAARPFAVAKPVVHYGSSITQGGCASNAGGSCQALVSRWLNVDFINLGFSGNGLGEPEVARAVAEIDASCFVLDFWGNPNAEMYRANLPRFVDTLRGRWPRTPILLVSPFYMPWERLTAPGKISGLEEKRRIAAAFVKERRKAGDGAIFFVDGLEMLSPAQVEGLVDGVHCNSLGFYFNALGLKPHLQAALKLKASRPPARDPKRIL